MSADTTQPDHGVVGTVIFRPLAVKFTQPQAPGVNPYCKLKLGWHSGKGSVSTEGDPHHKWTDNIVLERRHDEDFAKIKIKDQNRNVLTDRIGEAKIPLAEAIAKGKYDQWFPLVKGDQPIGDVHVEVEYHVKPIVS